MLYEAISKPTYPAHLFTTHSGSCSSGACARLRPLKYNSIGRCQRSTRSPPIQWRGKSRRRQYASIIALSVTNGYRAGV